MDSLERIIEQLHACRIDLATDNAKAAQAEVERMARVPNMPIMDGYETIDNAAWLDGGFRK